jgi:hypothetical protein
MFLVSWKLRGKQSSRKRTDRRLDAAATGSVTYSRRIRRPSLSTKGWQAPEKVAMLESPVQEIAE